jgi:hypothetical protein
MYSCIRVHIYLCLYVCTTLSDIIMISEDMVYMQHQTNNTCAATTAATAVAAAVVDVTPMSNVHHFWMLLNSFSQ